MVSFDKIAFLILNYCSASECIRLVKEIRYFNTKSSIVIVDNNSPDNSLHVLQEENIRLNFIILKSNTNGGYAKGNNVGLNYIENNLSCKYVVVCNPDIFITKNTLINLINHLDNDPTSAIAGGQMYDSNNVKQLSAWKLPKLADDIILSSSLFLRIFGNPTEYKEIQNLRYVDVIQGAFFVVRMKYFKQIGFFDENTFLYGEERIVGFKLKQHGKKLIFDPKLIFKHKVGETINKKYPSKIKTFRLLSQSRKIYYKNVRKEYFSWLLYSMFIALIYIEKKIIDIYLSFIKTK